MTTTMPRKLLPVLMYARLDCWLALLNLCWSMYIYIYIYISATLISPKERTVAHVLGCFRREVRVGSAARDTILSS
jgi:hypothetical protein